MSTRALLGLGRRKEASQRLNRALNIAGFTNYLYGSGTAALAAALKLAAQRSRSPTPEVVMPAYACPDLVSAARFAGLQPVLADNLPDLPWLDPTSVLAACTTNTVAVVYVRFLGLSANDAALRAALGTRGPLLIEDRAHSPMPHQTMETSADMVVMSFGRGKPVSVRNGGALLIRANERAAELPPPVPKLVTNDVANRWAHWVNCVLYNASIQPQVYWWLTRVLRMQVDRIGYRELVELDEFAPALRALLPIALERQRGSNAWREQLVASMLQTIQGPWVDVAQHSATRHHCGDAVVNDRLWRYPLLLSNESERDRLFSDLWVHGLGPSRMYRSLLSELPATAKLVRAAPCPRAQDFARRLLTLPLHADVRREDYEMIARRLQAFSPTARLAAASTHEYAA